MTKGMHRHLFEALKNSEWLSFMKMYNQPTPFLE